MAQFSAGAVRQPVRSVIEVGPDRAFFGIMPAALNIRRRWARSSSPSTSATMQVGLPSHLATIVLLDHATGALAAVLDGRYITEARTAAVSAVSVKHLARPDAHVLGNLGIGRAGAEPSGGDSSRAHADRSARVEPERRRIAMHFVTDMREATGLPIARASIRPRTPCAAPI